MYVRTCPLVQPYMDSGSATQLVWGGGRCSDLWHERVLPGLREYVQQLQDVLRSTAAQDELLTACEWGSIEW